jgi:nitroreductase
LQVEIAFFGGCVIFDESNMSTSTIELLSALEWRYATKQFDATKKIPADVWHALEKSLVLTPTSYGLQPYKFLVVQDVGKRTELMAHSWKQKQVVEASHFLVFVARTEMTEADVDRFLKHTAHIRQHPPEKLHGYREVIIKDVVTGPRGKAAHEWATRQAYIALGNLMTAAALLRVDTCPMEGLVPAEYDKILNLAGTGYATVVACALGYRSESCKYANLAKVRYEIKDLIQHV